MVIERLKTCVFSVYLQWLEVTDRFAVKLTGRCKVFNIWFCYYGYEVSLESESL